MTDLFKYNPTPWNHARCGDNWDINLSSEPDAKGVGVVATCFAGEDIARLLAAAPELYEALFAWASCYHPDLQIADERALEQEGCDPVEARLLANAVRSLAKARGEHD